jgi:hypothetical protein
VPLQVRVDIACQTRALTKDLFIARDLGIGTIDSLILYLVEESHRDLVASGKQRPAVAQVDGLAD